MQEEARVQKSIAEHVLWCREERERLANELVLYRTGLVSIGKRKSDGTWSQASLDQIEFLQRAIAQLDRLLAAFAGDLA